MLERAAAGNLAGGSAFPAPCETASSPIARAEQEQRHQSSRGPC